MSTPFDHVSRMLECPVCNKPFLDPVTLPCGHTFCREDLVRADRCFIDSCGARIKVAVRFLGSNAILTDASAYIARMGRDVTALQKVRSRLAKTKGVPAYFVASNLDLLELAAAQPMSLPDLQRVRGFGESRCAEYGTALLQALLEAQAGRSAEESGDGANADEDEEKAEEEQVEEGPGTDEYSRPKARQASTKRKRRSAAAAQSESNSAEISEGADAVFRALRNRRLELAREHGVSAFIVAPDTTLRAIAAALPTTSAELAEIAGMGPARCAVYGDAFLEIVRSSSSMATAT